MSQFNPIQIVNNDIKPVSNSAVTSAFQTVLNTVEQNSVANNILRYGGGATGLQTTVAPIQKFLSFYLEDQYGRLATVPKTNPYNFQPGYTFQMAINPANLKITLPPKTVVPARSLGGWRLQHWYPEIGTISATGIIGNMLEAFNIDLKDSFVWFKFKQLMQVYNLNGIPYASAGTTANRYQLQSQFYPSAVCHYDSVQYTGYFESLNYTEDENMPNTIPYDFVFRILDIKDTNDMLSLTQSPQTEVINAVVSAGNVILPGSAPNSILGTGFVSQATNGNKL